VAASVAADEAVAEPQLAPLEDLILRARTAIDRMGTTNENRAMLAELVLALIDQAQQRMLLEARLDERRIVLP
jgi:hypothetical protein